MAELRFKTRGGCAPGQLLNPRGKQKVFFSCHPDDFEACFEFITELILRYQNCAIWYTQPGCRADEIDFYGMNLMVIPVTERFLTMDSISYCYDLEMAKKHKIPVLPILMEEGLEPLFNAKCGNIQVLSAVTKDKTEIPFEVKLEQFLENVLVGDEQAERVRKAFDAYIFLSYRKMDRKYANELMRMIHQNPKCRDMAIWYDEFLTIGENYDEEIQQALAKSQLFVLLITPNLTKSSYIPEYEYKAARNLKKPILPTEMCKTDMAELKQYFQGLSDVVNGNDTEKFQDELGHKIEEFSTAKQEKDPLHDYYIGLAYLNGIDMEVDVDKALCLITGAANAGLRMAIDKLIQIYRYGIGVKRDYLQSAGWSEKLVELLEQTCEEEPSEENQRSLLYACRGAGNAWLELNAYDKAEYYYKKLLQADRNIFPDWLAAGYSYLGDVCRARSDVSGMKKWSKQALALNIELYEKNRDDTETCRQLAVAFANMGDLHYQLGEWELAFSHYREQNLLMDELMKKTDDLIIQREYFISLERLGDVLMQMNRKKEARSFYVQFCKLTLQLLRETQGAEAARDLARGYEKIGDICREEDNWEDAKEWYAEALQLKKDIHQATGLTGDLRELLNIFYRVADVHMHDGELQQAWDCYTQNCEIAKQLLEECGDMEAKREYARCYERLGVFWCNLKDQENAMQNAIFYLDQCRQLREELLQSFEIPPEWAISELLAVYDNLGIVYFGSGLDDKMAEHYFVKSLSIRPSEQIARFLEALRNGQ